MAQVSVNYAMPELSPELASYYFNTIAPKRNQLTKSSRSSSQIMQCGFVSEQ